MKKYTWVLLVFFGLLSSCKKQDEIISPSKSDISVLEINAVSDWNYWVINKKGDNMFIKSMDGHPKVVYFKAANVEEGLTLYLDDNSLPEKMVLGKQILIFSNIKDSQFDVALINETGQIELVREVQTKIPWGSFEETKTNFGRLSGDNWQKQVEWASHVSGLLSCAISASVPHIALTSMAILVAGCLHTVVGLASELLPIEYGKLEIGESSTVLGAFYGILGCAGKRDISCLLDIISITGNVVLEADKYLEQQEDNIRLSEGSLNYGYGDVQATLTWNNETDLDLYVIDPEHNQIYWETPWSATGGQLDVDDIDGFGPENIFWPRNGAPKGGYALIVHHYEWPEEQQRPQKANYKIQVTAFGKAQTFSGTIEKGEYIHVCTFGPDGIRKVRQKSNYIPKNSKK